MARRLKLLTGLSCIALTSALALSACSGSESEGAKEAGENGNAAHHGDAGGGDAEQPSNAGSESEGAAMAEITSDKAVYLSALQIVRGHLRAGVELYASGDRDLGPQHLRHPQAEILTTLAPAFAAFGATSIEPAIDALAAAGEAGASPAEIATLEAAVFASVANAGASANPGLKDRLLAVAKTLTIAGDEYSVAVNDGQIVNLHEYHDAYGFIAVAISDLESMSGENDAEEAAIASVLEQAKVAATAAPSIAPPASGLAPASLIYGAAARIEIVARAL